MYGYIYKTTDLTNGKIYIGQHKSDTFVAESYVGSGIILRNIKKSLEQSGLSVKDRFKTELIEECSSDEELNEREIYWISYYNSMDPSIGYNLHEGGLNTIAERNGMFGRHQSDESKQKNREYHEGTVWITDGNVDKQVKPECVDTYLQNGFVLGRSNQRLDGKKLPLDVVEKISKSLSGVKKSDEHRKKLSMVAKGRVYVTNGVVTKRVYPEEAEELIKQGFRYGRIFNSNSWNKGMTAENSKKLKELGQKTRNTRLERGNYIPWNKGLKKSQNP